MVDSTAEGVLAEVNHRRKRVRLLPLGIGVGVVGAILLMPSSGSAPVLYSLYLAAAAILCLVLAAADRSRRRLPITYDLDPVFALSYDALCDAFKSVGSCGGRWHVGAEGRVRETKYHAGAGTLVSRTATAVTFDGIPPLRANIPVPTLPVGRQHLVFLPDTVLVYDGSKAGAVAYGDIRVETSEVRFIEDGAVPHDTAVVDRTWRYVNKNGGPDRRFTNNRELPVVLYGEARLTSPTGLNEVIQTSRPDAVESLKDALTTFAKAIADLKAAGPKPEADAPVPEPLVLQHPCPHCSKVLVVPTKFRGLGGTCKYCGGHFVLPAG